VAFRAFRGPPIQCALNAVHSGKFSGECPEPVRKTNENVYSDSARRLRNGERFRADRGTFARCARGFDPGWESEESLNIEWAHAMAPGATIYLVEAASASLDDLLAAVTVANQCVAAKGGGELSMRGGWTSSPAKPPSTAISPNEASSISPGPETVAHCCIRVPPLTSSRSGARVWSAIS